MAVHAFFMRSPPWELGPPPPEVVMAAEGSGRSQGGLTRDGRPRPAP